MAKTTVNSVQGQGPLRSLIFLHIPLSLIPTFCNLQKKTQLGGPWHAFALNGKNSCKFSSRPPAILSLLFRRESVRVRPPLRSLTYLIHWWPSVILMSTLSSWSPTFTASMDIDLNSGLSSSLSTCAWSHQHLYIFLRRCSFFIALLTTLSLPFLHFPGPWNGILQKTRWFGFVIHVEDAASKLLEIFLQK